MAQLSKTTSRPGFMMRSLVLQVRSTFLMLSLTLTASLLVLGVVLLLHWWKGIPINYLGRDPATVLEAPFYVGFLSNLGVMLWSAAAALCLFGAVLAGRSAAEGNLKRFLYASGLLTLLLALDDLFLLHEEVFPEYVGIPQKLVYAIYGLIAILFMLRFYAVILQTEYFLFGLALLFLGASVGMDVLNLRTTAAYFLEDGAKFMGIAMWFTYFARVAAYALRSEHSTPRVSQVENVL